MKRLVLAVGALGSLCSGPALLPPLTPQAGATATGIHKIQHVIIIMQENRSFDSYFGTFPGAVGIPMKKGCPPSAAPDPASGNASSHSSLTTTKQGWWTPRRAAAVSDINGGKMNGFVRTAETGAKACKNPANPTASTARPATPDVMGYHVRSDIPNYWAYAKNFVLRIICSSPWPPTASPAISTWSRAGALTCSSASR